MNKKKSNPSSPKGLTLNLLPGLPEHFAEHVLDYETELDLDCNINTILKLMELYKSAIEYYESINDPKYIHYQERLHNLLARKDVITLLNVGSPTSVSKLTPGEIIKKMQDQVAIRQRYRSYQVNMFMTKCLTENRDAESAMKKHNSENNLVRAKAIENLRLQEEESLEMKIEARRRRSGTPIESFNRTMSSNSFTRISKMDKYREELENIIEKCAEEKNSMIKDIKKKYKEEIKQVKQIGGEGQIINDMISQMKQSLKLEIIEIEKKIREKKNKMVDEIKLGYN
ncbi:hypothetical protein SteCoe_13824 [Stentor coeruleus]|uniref:Uncharacterized protein n=1 Tax=Stentor coeruleus TaxID=5963 RepID=A0A1R2C7K5_9CILI|nr:hypothetical protein SteCoe_13824 [Stentor coeruleus]